MTLRVGKRESETEAQTEAQWEKEKGLEGQKGEEREILKKMRKFLTTH